MTMIFFLIKQENDCVSHIRVDTKCASKIWVHLWKSCKRGWECKKLKGGIINPHIKS